MYYESNFDNSDDNDHEVRILEGGRVATVCRFDRKIVTTIRSIKH